MPCKREFAQRVTGEIAHAKARHKSLEVAPVQDVEPAERDAAGANLLHAWLVFAPPGVREGGPVEVIPKRLQNPFGLAGNPRPPVDEGSKHVEKYSPNGGHGAAHNLVFWPCRAPARPSKIMVKSLKEWRERRGCPDRSRSMTYSGNVP